MTHEVVGIMLGNFLGHLPSSIPTGVGVHSGQTADPNGCLEEFREGCTLLDHVVGSGLARGVPDVVGPIVCPFVAIPVLVTAEVFGRLLAEVALTLTGTNRASAAPL
jgi:hypothetical protein